MADKKISALTGASLPLGGTEVLPIVQSGSTKNVSVAALTAGRSPLMNYAVTNNGVIIQNGGVNRWFLEREVGAGDDFFVYRYNDDGSYAGNPLQISRSNGNVRLEGNLVIGTSGKGIDFSATTEGSGTMTSELLDDYEEGIWTPSQGAGLTVVGDFSSSGTYTKIGRSVTVSAILFGSTSILVTTNGLITSNLPFTQDSGNATGICLDSARASSTFIVASGVNIYGSAATSASSYILFSITYTV